ncbi:hypothetical protein [Hydrogenophaga sp. NH-16]|uniref:hypothetical protein n=1 Tax=Hydrogenophaga sp. NH-16 TaxID=2184519 RepID=UPI000FD7F98E|nr:hypothetical protein [Hydrogenophaga sp. NH-16]
MLVFLRLDLLSASAVEHLVERLASKAESETMNRVAHRRVLLLQALRGSQLMLFGQRHAVVAAQAGAAAQRQEAALRALNVLRWLCLQD